MIWTAEARAKLSAAMKGNRNGCGPRDSSVSAQNLRSLNAMMQDRGGRLLRWLAEHPEEDAARKAKIAASRQATAAARKTEREQAKVDRELAREALASLTPARRTAMAQGWAVSQASRMDAE